MGLAGQEAAPSPSPAPAASLSAEAGEGLGMMRIYVGGLSKSVTAADMEKTFSALGRVAGLDFVRTNDRSFAYMDFHPASDRSLAKLFSMYNGCIWKGGKLKLEKAKEHYLTRLKKEWEEDANVMLTPHDDPIPTHVDPIPEKNAVHLKKLDTLKQENTHLNIFFPKLRKVKSVPFKGTGKHKYSFQRIEVPPLPIHFCDCEEHYDEHEMASKKYLSSLDKVINEKELHVMNSVMNKLLKKECNGTSAVEMVKPARDATISDTSNDNIQCEEVEGDQGTDADNLVTNIVMGGSSGMLRHTNGGKTQTKDQETKYRKLQPFKDRSIQTKANSLKRNKSGMTDALEVTPNKRFHPVMVDQEVEDEFTPILSRNASSQGQSQETKISAEAPPVKSQTEPDMDTFQSRKGNSWLQKSSWKDLVGKMDSSSFSISDILPGINQTAPKTVKTNVSGIAVPTAAKKRKSQSDGKEPRSVTVLHNILPKEAIGLSHVEKSKESNGIQANLEFTVAARDNGDQEPERTEAETAASEAIPSKSLHPALQGKITESVPILPHKVSEGHSKEPEVIADGSTIRSQNDTSMDDIPSKKGNSWFQKSSWKDLVGENASSSFSISNILPGINTSESNLSKNSNSASAISTAAKNKKAQSDEDKSNPMQTLQQINQLKKPIEPCHMRRSDVEDGILAKPEGGYSKALENDDVVRKRTTPPVGTSGVCTFMRSEESLKEWTRLKSALSGFISKKSAEKDTSRISKGMPSQKH